MGVETKMEITGRSRGWIQTDRRMCVWLVPALRAWEDLIELLRRNSLEEVRQIWLLYMEGKLGVRRNY